MKYVLSEYVWMEQKYDPFDLFFSSELDDKDEDFWEYKAFGYNPTIIHIQDFAYRAIPLYKLARMKNEDGYFRFIYIQINIENGEYYIGKVNRKKWNEVLKYQGSGLLFTLKFEKNTDKFVRYYIAHCITKEECEETEHKIVNQELLKDGKCLNLVSGGGGTNNHYPEKRRKSLSKYMHSHPEAFQSMILEAKRLFCDKDSEALKKRAEKIKKTMSDDKYKIAMSERIKNWRKDHPEEYEKSLEKSRIAQKSEEVKDKKKKSRLKWIKDHPEEYKENIKKFVESTQTDEAKAKRSNSLKEWNKNNPEQSKINNQKRSKASVEICRKPVAMKDLETGEILRVFKSQHEAATWLVDNKYAKTKNCVASISSVCLKKPCTTGYGYRKKAYGFGWDFEEK